METKEAKALYNTAPGIRFEKGKPLVWQGIPARLGVPAQKLTGFFGGS
ncbi:MAG: hypothetical protein LKH78_08220 [Weizmannia coagulans]|jgi:hypothetical protein|nr:hypothetical protein [Heyndrickxia coagulans]